MSLQDWMTSLDSWAKRDFLIIGQAPARSATDDMRPWDSASGKRLAKMLGMEHEQMLNIFDTTNLNRTLHGTNGRWDKFDATEAAERAERLTQNLWRWKAVLCCGAKVAKHMGVPLLEWDYRTIIKYAPNGERHYPVWIGAIPHPGGTNFYWNDKDKRETAEEYLRTFGDYLRFYKKTA